MGFLLAYLPQQVKLTLPIGRVVSLLEGNREQCPGSTRLKRHSLARFFRLPARETYSWSSQNTSHSESDRFPTGPALLIQSR